MEGLVNLSALAIERASFAEKAAQSEMLRNYRKAADGPAQFHLARAAHPAGFDHRGADQPGRIRKADQSADKLDPATSLELIDSATRQAQRLNRLVENLLDMTRLEAGALHLNREPADLQDLIGTVLSQTPRPFLRSSRQGRACPPELPLVSMDAVLVARCWPICWITPANIHRLAARSRSMVRLYRDQDRGGGQGPRQWAFPPEDLERVFDKFYRVQRQEQVVGTGLGLSICKGIIEAHDGRIWADK